MADQLYDYDMVVIGTGPSGQRAAIQAAKLGKRVAIIERRVVVGGVCINTGTIPSKTLREAALYLSGYRERSMYGASYAVKHGITMTDLLLRCDIVMRNEIEVIKAQMYRNNVDLFESEASFVDPHTIRLRNVAGRGIRDVTAAFIVIAVGTNATRGDDVPFDGHTIFTSDDILTLDRIPKTLTVVGAGVIGCEYACIFATIGVRVTLVDMRPSLLPFVDEEIGQALAYHMREQRVTLRLGEQVSGIELTGDGRVRVCLRSGKQFITEKCLNSIGRTGATRALDLSAAGLSADNRGRLAVNEHYQTAVPHIYAVGDVIGFPSLASTSMEQGRLAACHAFNAPTHSVPSLFPYGIYTIPEISMVGKHEGELTTGNIPYEVGKAHYREVARGQILGDQVGMLKLVFHLENRKLMGVHIIGEGASELIHIGQAVMAFEGTIDYFIDTVFNYPTLAEAYKIAAFDGINRLVSS